MILQGPLDTLARYAARIHTATGTITRPGAGEPVFDPETGGYTDPPPVTVYAGKLKVVYTGSSQVTEFGQEPVDLRSYDVEIADTTVDVHIGDTVTVTASRDPLLAAGRKLTVIDVPKSDLVTIRRLTTEEVLT